MACKRKISKRRKGQNGLETMDMSSLSSAAGIAGQGMALENQVGSGIASAFGWSATPDEYGYIDPTEAGASAGMSNLGFTPLAVLSSFTAMRDAKKNNQKIDEARKFSGMKNNFNQLPYISGQEGYTPLMPYGGNVGSETVELERGEPFRTPDGTIHSIPTSAPSHAKGGVVLDLPVGTQVLGKLKSPAGNQFKELGSKLSRMQKRYDLAEKTNPTSIETRTAKRMLDNINKEYTSLFEQQGVDTFRTIGDNNMEQFAKGGSIHINPKNKGKFNALKKRTGKSTEELTHSNNPLTRKRAIFAQNARKWRKGGDGLESGYYPSHAPLNEPEEYNMFYGANVPIQNYTGNVPTVQQPLTKSTDKFNTGQLSDLSNTVGSLAPVFYNVAQGLKKPDELNVHKFANPYENSSRSLMRSRKYNMMPELRRNALERATYMRGLKESGLSKGQMLSGMSAGSMNQMRANSETIGKAQNINNQYLGEQAQFDAQLGRDTVGSKFRIQDINDANAAARRNYLASASSQLGQYSQNRQLMGNQKQRDTQLMQLLPSLVTNYTFDPTTGMWVHKQSGQKVTQEEALNSISKYIG